jgi:RNA polymerase sigma-70 factor (ECF subfamily)
MADFRRRDILAARLASAPDQLPDAALLARVRAGDEAAFEYLFKAYFRPLCEFAYGYVGSRETAEELVQTIFLKLWQKRATWEPAVGIRAYLFAAARNSALDHPRHEQVVRRTLGADDGDLGPRSAVTAKTPAPDEAVQASELAAALNQAMEELPERRRSVVTLRWHHQLTNAEIANALGISVKGVEAHLSRALFSLRARLRAFRS